MKYQRFSPRQTLTLTWWKRPEFADYDGILCDGSIRSGKTVSMAVGFILWSMYSFNNESFAICGRTIESLRRNVIVHLPSWLEGLFKVTERRAENKMCIRDRLWQHCRHQRARRSGHRVQGLCGHYQARRAERAQGGCTARKGAGEAHTARGNA